MKLKFIYGFSTFFKQITSEKKTKMVVPISGEKNFNSLDTILMFVFADVKQK
jgi:hypothetical protein